MLYKLRTRARRRLFDRQIAGILRTPPIAYRPSSLTILSQTCHADVSMHLLAVKSFYARIGHGKIVIIDDGSLTEEDRAVFRFHLVEPEIVALNAIPLDGLIPGNTWERLAHSIDLSAESYVIQIDSDILTVGEIDEVKDAIAANRSFILGTWNGLKKVPVKEASAYADTIDGGYDRHVQTLCERNLYRLQNAEQRYYVRGSSGFYGFARGAVTREAAAGFCNEMLNLVGPRFHEWGSEQLTANFLAANARDSLVLPYPSYACFGPELNPDAARLFHFVGIFRFKNGEYARRARRRIAELR